MIELFAAKYLISYFSYFYYKSYKEDVLENLYKRNHSLQLEEGNTNISSTIYLRAVAQKLFGFYSTVVHSLFLRHGTAEHRSWHGFL